MATDLISPDLKVVLRRFKLGRILDTLPEHLVRARQKKMPRQDFLVLVLSDRPAAATPRGCARPEGAARSMQLDL